MNGPTGPDEQRTGSRLTHLDGGGHARMVDITSKTPTLRRAEARCAVVTSAHAPSVLQEVDGDLDLLEAARNAGIHGAKMTAALIPLCHSIRINGISIDISVGPHRVDISTVTEVIDRTGVEMEALTACAVAALTIYAALRQSDPMATVEELTLWHKSGGRSGDWHRRD
jgi:cyclic pyranopterin phosphate synthase